MTMCKECEAAVELAEAQRRKIGRLQSENGRLKRRLADLESGSDRPPAGAQGTPLPRPSVLDRVPVQMTAAEYRRLMRNVNV